MLSVAETIAHWFWTNKEWLFSGIGVAFILWFLNVVFRRRPTTTGGSPDNQGNKQNPASALYANVPAFSESDYSQRPTPAEIASQLDSLPIFQRSAVKESYVGLKVRWRVELFNLTELGNAERKAFQTDATHCLQAHPRIRPECTVWANVNVNAFPHLKISHAGTLLRIFGTISKITDSDHVRLKDVSIAFGEARHNGRADYSIGEDGTTITFASERAINRVSGPKPKQGWRLVFRSRQEAAQFLEIGESEGYSFEGKEFL